MHVRDTAKFLKFDLGKLAFGRAVEVTLSGSIANVKLINNSNMFNYERSREYQYTGGLVKESSTKLHIPHTDHWFIVVDTQGMEGFNGDVTASVKIH